MKILLVEDDPQIADICRRALVEAGYVVDVVGDGRTALDSFELYSYDLLILDLLLPDPEVQGLEVCRQVRLVNTSIPVLLLTALDSPRDKVKGLDAGADDYLVKPFHISELLARTRALLRRSPHAEATILRVSDVELNPAIRQAKRGGRTIDLTAKEYGVLEYLLRNAGRIVSQTELLEHAWDSNYIGMSNVVETYVRYLRKKLNANGEPDIIETRRGSGYIIHSTN
jgi:DNA-binding response OmpR family regulator